jgi:multimeric flavodoxin WrbA
MKALILNGSPRPKGSVTKILSEVSKNLKNKFEVEMVDVYKLDFKPCIGCRGCRKNETECIMKEDEAQIIGRKMNESDVIIVGSPTHFNNMSAQLKSLLDRNGTTLFQETKPLPTPNLKGKKAIIVTACVTPLFFNFLLGMTRGTIKTIILNMEE